MLGQWKRIRRPPTGTENHGIPSSVPAVSDPVSSVIPPFSAPPGPIIPLPAFVPATFPFTKNVAQTTPPPPLGRKRRRIKPEDMENAFRRGGSRTLTLTEAVEALESFWFRPFGSLCGAETERTLCCEAAIRAGRNYYLDGMSRKIPVISGGIQRNTAVSASFRLMESTNLPMENTWIFCSNPASPVSSP